MAEAPDHAAHVSPKPTPSPPPSCVTARSTWAKLAVLVVLLQFASVGITAGLTYVIVAHHKEVNVVAGLLTAQGDPRALPVATSAALHEWDIRHVRLLTLAQLRALRSVTVPLNATVTAVHQIRGAVVHTPEGSLEHSLVVLQTAAGDELHVIPAHSADAAGSSPSHVDFTYEGGLTTPPFTARQRFTVLTCTGVTNTTYPLGPRLSGDEDPAGCPSSLVLVDGATGAQQPLQSQLPDGSLQRRRRVQAGFFHEPFTSVAKFHGAAES